MESNEPKNFSTPKKPRFLCTFTLYSFPFPERIFPKPDFPFLHKHLLLSNLSTQLGSKNTTTQTKNNKENHNNNHSFPDRLFQRFKFNEFCASHSAGMEVFVFFFLQRSAKNPRTNSMGEGSSAFLFLAVSSVNVQAVVVIFGVVGLRRVDDEQARFPDLRK